MKIKPLYFVLPLIFCLAVYATFAFAMWDINPVNWRETDRAFFSFIAFIVQILGIALARDICKKKY